MTMSKVRSDWSARFFVLTGVISFGVFAFAALDLAVLNSRIREVIARMSLQDVAAQIEVADFGMRGNVTEKWASTARVTKTGPINTLDLNVRSLKYDFPQGGNPSVYLDAQVAFDFVKAVGQTNVNELAELIPDIILDLLSDYTQPYGDSLDLAIGVDEIRKDAQGDVEFVKISGRGQIDLERLPAGLERKKQPVVSVELQANATRTGFSLAVNAVLNPGYEGFETNQIGLKQILEGLIARDPQLVLRVESIIKEIDSIAGFLVNLQPDEEEQ